MQQRLDREIVALRELLPCVDDFCREQGLAEGLSLALRLAAEEIFTNLVRHNEGGGEHVLVELRRDGDEVVLRLSDYEVAPFSPEQADTADLDAPLAERRPGGMGLHLVRALMDALDYRYADGVLTVTVKKRVEA